MFSRKKYQAYHGFFPNGVEQYPHQSSMHSNEYIGRQQSFHYPYPAPPIEWNPNWYQNQPHHPGPMNPYQYGQGSSHLGAMPFVGQSGTLNHPQTPNIFQNPLQPHEQTQSYYYPNSQTNPANYYPNPYPQQSFNQKQSKGINSVMNSFKAQDGSVDINKMINTAGQMMNAVSQVSSMVKGLGGMLKV